MAKDWFKRNVIVLIFDSLPSHQFLNTKEKPFIDKLMKEGKYFDKAYSPANWTLPAMTSFFCGRLPHQDGSEQILQNTWNLPALAKENGYNTYMYGVKGMLFFSPYREFFTRYKLFEEESCADVIVDDVLENVKEPYIVFILFNESHYWYEPGSFKMPKEMKSVTLGAYYPKPEPKEGQMEYLKEKQRSAVTFLDKRIKRLLENIKGEPITIITSDHGELFGEDGLYYHAWGFHENLYHVPLLIHNLKWTDKVRFSEER